MPLRLLRLLVDLLLRYRTSSLLLLCLNQSLQLILKRVHLLLLLLLRWLIGLLAHLLTRHSLMSLLLLLDLGILILRCPIDMRRCWLLLTTTTLQHCNLTNRGIHTSSMSLNLLLNLLLLLLSLSLKRICSQIIQYILLSTILTLQLLNSIFCITSCIS